MNTYSLALPTQEIFKDTLIRSDPWICPDFKVSGLFSSHMVLQRNRPIRIWGFSNRPGNRIHGEFMQESVFSVTNSAGDWMLTFSAHEPTREPQTLQIYDDYGHRVSMEDILIGDVFLIGGQSNAEYHFCSCAHRTPDYRFDENDHFRFFMQAQGYVMENMSLCLEPQKDIINPNWCWKLPGQNATMEFSAIGCYFAKEMQKHIDVPCGYVMAAMGGASLKEMMPREIAYARGYFQGNNVPIAGYYNTLIHPLFPLAFKAMLFFQGESEGGQRDSADDYAEDLALLICDERSRFGQDFPLYNVQLSDYPGESDRYFPFLDIVRIRQFEAYRIIPQYHVSVSWDLGSEEDYPDWAHSPYKEELGIRLAKAVLAKEYGLGREEDVSSPRPTCARLSPDKKHITVSFTHTAAGLCGKDGTAFRNEPGTEITGFSLGKYETRIKASAHLLAADTVLVDVPEGADISCLGYVFSHRIPKGSANLYNLSGLPSPSFLIPVEN